MYVCAQTIDVHAFFEGLYAYEIHTIVACAGHSMITIYCALNLRIGNL